MGSTGGSPEKRLAAALAGWSDARLAALVRARPDLAAPPLTDFPGFVRRLVGGAAAQSAYRGLDRFCQQIVDALCLLAGSAAGPSAADPTVAEVTALLGHALDDDDIKAAVTRLENAGVVFAMAGRLHLVAGLRELRYPAGLGPPAKALLGRVSVANLAAMARRLGVEPGRSKATALAAVARALADPAVAVAAVDAGPPGSRELAEVLSQHHPVVTVPGGTFYLNDRTPVGWFALRGLLAPLSWDAMAMPREAGVGLRGGRPFSEVTGRPPILETTPVDAEKVDAVAADQALRLVADVAVILDAFSDVPARRLKTGGIGIRDVRRAAKAVGRGEEETARVIDLAAQAGLVAMDTRLDEAMPTTAYDEWLVELPPRRWRVLVQAWLASDLHLSLAGALDTKGKPIPPLLARGLEPDAKLRRRRVLDILAGLEPGQAADRLALGRRLASQAPLVWGGGPASPPVLIDWQVAEAEMVGLSSMGGLATAGRLAASGRMDEAAAALATRAPDVVDTFVIQADFSAMAPGELVHTVRAELELLADVESTGAATVFRFSEATIARALIAGRRPEEITGFLEAHATRGVPQPLAYLVADLGRRFGRVRVGTARCYLRSDDESLLAELASSRRCRGLGLRLLAPTVLAASMDPAEVLAAVRAAGYLAAEEGPDGELVIARPQPRRVAPAVPAAAALLSRSYSQAPLDPAAVVAALRRPAPAPKPAAPKPAAPKAPARMAPARMALFLDEDDDDDDDDDGDADDGDAAARPTHIASGVAAVGVLLELACEEEWLVRVAYSDAAGPPMQINAAIMEVLDGVAFVDRVPGWTGHEIPLADVRWARVMTTAEEECVLP